MRHLATVSTHVVRGTADALPRTAICLGTEVATGAPFWLPVDALTRGVHVRGAIGAGKTSVIRQLLIGRGIEAPWAHFDYVGTGHRELQAWIAMMATAYAVAEEACPELRGTTAAFLRRFAFLAIGAPNPSVRIDLLRRRMLPGNRREHLRDVVSRAVEVLYVKLNDAEGAQRVRFHRIATALVTALAAGERPIGEGLTLLADPMYMPFLDREIAARRFRASEITFLQHQRAELEHVLRLRPADITKSWRAFEDETASTRNSLADFAPGTVLGDIFNDESLALEDVVFGRTCLSVTNREAEDQQKTKAYQAIHAMLHALALHRQDVPDLPPLLVVADEPWWMRRNLPGILAVSRNLGVSYLISHQSDAQFMDIGLPTMPQQLRALTNLQIGFRPTSFEDSKDEVLHTTEIEPDGLVQRFWTSTFGTSDTSSSTVSRSWAQALRYSDYAEFQGSAQTTGHGEASVSGSASSMGEHEVLNIIGFTDQVQYLAQAALRRSRFSGVVTEDGDGTLVRFAPAPTFPAVLFGVPILDIYRKHHNASWRACTRPRTPYDPFAGAAFAVELDQTPAVSDAVQSRDSEHPAAPAPPRLDARPPLAPPRFDGSATPPAKKRRRSGRKPRA